MRTKEEIALNILKRHYKEDTGEEMPPIIREFRLKSVEDSMDEYAEQEVKSNAATIVNLFCKATKTVELLNKPLTIGEVKQMVDIYAREVAIQFFNQNCPFANRDCTKTFDDWIKSDDIG